MSWIFSSSGIVRVMAFLAIGWYFFSIVYVGTVPDPVTQKLSTEKKTTVTKDTATTTSKPADLRAYMVLSISTIGGTLATFTGLAFGIQQVTSRTSGDAVKRTAASTAGIADISGWQILAVFAYIASLILAVCLWWVYEDKCDDVVRNLARSFLGLVGGGLAVILNVKS